MNRVIPFAEWLPDLPDYENPGALEALNVVPRAVSYSPFRALAPQTGALDAFCQGHFAYKDYTGTSHNFAGDADKLYKLASGNWSDVSATSGYTMSDLSRWNFAPFGLNVIAFNGVDVQKYLIGTSTEFEALGGTPPAFRYGAVVREFMLVGNIGTANQNRIAWCDQNDVEEWSTGQAGSLDIPKGGDVRGITGGEYGVVFQERAINRFDYVGGESVWQRRTVQEGLGLFAEGSLAKHGNLNFFLSEDGFYMFDGAGVTPIGYNKVDKTILADIDQTYTNKITSVIDPINKFYIMGYAGSGNMGIANKIVIYDYANNKWSRAETEHEWLTAALSSATGLDSITGSLDALQISLDSRAWLGGALLLAGFSTDHKLGYFSGSTLAARIQTAEMQLTPGMRSLVTNLRPLVNGVANARISTRTRLADAPSWGSVALQNSEGEVPILSEGRYQRIETQTTAAVEWDQAQGVAVDFTGTGAY